MAMRRMCIACVASVGTAAAAEACGMPSLEGVDTLRLHRPAAGAVVSGFGLRKHPLLAVSRFHYGLDIAAREGAPVEAAAPGRIVTAAPEGVYGNTVRIDHGDGLATLYAHLSRIGVQTGECVQQGAVIGQAGATGLTARTMLHFEMLVDGKPVDPAPSIGAAR